MPNTIYKNDRGTNFGSGDDPISNLIYRDSAKTFLQNVSIAGKRIADYGGANAILRRFLGDADAYTVVDTDKTKQTGDDFICDDITTHRGQYDLVICRYVLHYLTDEQIRQMFAQIKTNGTAQILLIQFVNQGLDLKIKREISAQFETGEERKIFRNCRQLFDLLDGFHIENVDKVDYLATSDFYRNRFGTSERVTPHQETIYSILLGVKN